MRYEELLHVERTGVEILEGFVDESEIEAILEEVNNPDKVQWLDAHEVYTNKRGLTIVQNHFTFALKLSAGDQSMLDKLPATVALKDRIQAFIRSLSPTFPSLANWEADELSFHLYDDEEVGLSQHRDNLRFTGLVAIASLSGECDLVVKHHDQDIRLSVSPGHLSLIRAPGLIETNEEVRPEHSVENLRTETRLSMMIRANNQPSDKIPGFKFNNW